MAPPAMEKSPAKLGQCDRLVIKLMQARAVGLLTAEMFAGMKMAKYTGRISDCRARHHDIRARPEGTLRDGIKTVQWRYFYAGYGGKEEWLKQEVKATLESWQAFRLLWDDYSPWVEIKAA